MDSTVMGQQRQASRGVGGKRRDLDKAHRRLYHSTLGLRVIKKDLDIRARSPIERHRAVRRYRQQLVHLFYLTECIN